MRKLIKTVIKAIGNIRKFPQIKPNPANLQAFYQIQVISPDGKVKFDTRLRESHSFVFQFLQMLEGCFRRTTMSNITDTGSVSRNFTMTTWQTSFFDVLRALAGNSLFGIVIGSGTAAENNTDIALDTQIAHGVEASQLQYGVHSYIPTRVVGANVDCEVNRMFINDSGGNVTVNEVGIYVRMYEASPSGYRYVCIIRDLTGGIVVNDGNVMFVRYVLRTTV